MSSYLQSRQFRIQVNQVFGIVIFWILLMAFEIVIEYAIITFLKLDYRDEDLLSGLILNVVSAFFAGILGGSFLVFAWNRWLRVMSYGRSLLAIFISFTLIFITIFLTTNAFSAYFNMYDEIYPEGESLIQSGPILVTYSKWLIISLFTLILLQVNDKYGPGVFRSFVLGKYFHPKHEERLFMFLDLKSSTTIAEKLGEINYFNFLKESYQTVTPSIIENRAEVYQYVGDEIVISWEMNSKLNISDCAETYFRMQQALDNNHHFESKYGIKPFFKAGLHGGRVMAGEMGVIKREIAYSGDVLNTTARIQSKCNEFNAGLLISSFVMDRLEAANGFIITPIGDIELRGKEEALELFKVEVLNT